MYIAKDETSEIWHLFRTEPELRIDSYGDYLSDDYYEVLYYATENEEDKLCELDDEMVEQFKWKGQPIEVSFKSGKVKQRIKIVEIDMHDPYCPKTKRDIRAYEKQISDSKKNQNASKQYDNETHKSNITLHRVGENIFDKGTREVSYTNYYDTSHNLVRTSYNL